MDQRKEIKKLEEESIDIHRAEMDIDHKSDQITMTLVNNITPFAIMMTLGAVYGLMFLSERILYPFLGVMTVIFFMRVGRCASTAFKRITKLQMMMHEIGLKKEILKKNFKILKHEHPTYGGILVGFTLKNETRGSKEFKEDYNSVIILVCVASLFPLAIVSSTVWACMNTGSGLH